jgi:hypothetical protein
LSWIDIQEIAFILLRAVLSKIYNSTGDMH